MGAAIATPVFAAATSRAGVAPFAGHGPKASAATREAPGEPERDTLGMVEGS